MIASKCFCFSCLFLVVKFIQLVCPADSQSLPGKPHAKPDARAKLEKRNSLLVNDRQIRSTSVIQAGLPVKESASLKDIENVLFDRERLKRYVLHYLWTHPKKRGPFNTSNATKKRRLPRYRKKKIIYHHSSPPYTHSSLSKTEREKHKNTDMFKQKSRRSSVKKLLPSPSVYRVDYMRRPMNGYPQKTHWSNIPVYPKASITQVKRKKHNKNSKTAVHLENAVGVRHESLYHSKVTGTQHNNKRANFLESSDKASLLSSHRHGKTVQINSAIPSNGNGKRDVIWYANKNDNHERKGESALDELNKREFLKMLKKSFDFEDLVVEPVPEAVRTISKSQKYKTSNKKSIRRKSLALDSHKDRAKKKYQVREELARKKMFVREKMLSWNGGKTRDSKAVRFSPFWNSLNKRKIPSWYDEAKFGIFVHWGVFSVPSFGNEWFWFNWKGRKVKDYLNYTEKNFPPGFSYAEFAPMFKAEFFDAEQWAKLVARSGARYFVFTSKHHEGFTNWNSSAAWNWNSVDVGPHRNIVGELAHAFRKFTDVKFGLYYSLYEWFNPHYLKDKANKFKTDEYIQAVVKPQLYDLVNTYKPEYIWSDGDWEAPDTYWKSKEFLTWLFNDSPVRETVVVNSRWGLGCSCRHGTVLTGVDRFNPGNIQKMKWENAMTIDRYSWGFRREASIEDYFTIEELVKELVSTVSCGGNLLMNVGPSADGTISPIFQERLTQMGDWLKVNGEAIFGTKPWRAQSDTVSGSVWYTTKENHVYAISLKWPSSGKLELNHPIASKKTRVKMLGVSKKINWKQRTNHKGKGGIEINFPTLSVSQLPCLWAWVFKLSDIS